MVTIKDIRAAQKVLRQYLSPAPLLRSFKLEKKLGLDQLDRRVYIKDYGWTPVGSFKVMGALNWMSNNQEAKLVAAHSSGNFASGLAYAGKAFGKEVTVVMPDTAPACKQLLTQSFGAVLHYDISTDHITGVRDALTHRITEERGGVEASPYDDPHVIAGNGVGGLEIANELQSQGRECSHFICAVSGGGLMAGHAVAMRDAYHDADIVGVEPDLANDFQRSLAAGERVRLERPTSICDGLLSYDVGEHNWPLLQANVNASVTVTDGDTKAAMRWMYERHGLVTEPSGACALAAVLTGAVPLSNKPVNKDIVIVLSGRNVDENSFCDWLTEAGHQFP